MELAAAYGLPGLAGFARRLRLAADGVLHLGDSFTRRDRSMSVEEVLVTWLPAVLADGAVVIAGRLRISSLQPGHWLVEEVLSERRFLPSAILRRCCFMAQAPVTRIDLQSQPLA